MWGSPWSEDPGGPGTRGKTVAESVRDDFSLRGSVSHPLSLGPPNPTPEIPTVTIKSAKGAILHGMGRIGF